MGTTLRWCDPLACLLGRAVFLQRLLPESFLGCRTAVAGDGKQQRRAEPVATCGTDQRSPCLGGESMQLNALSSYSRDSDQIGLLRWRFVPDAPATRGFDCDWF